MLIVPPGKAYTLLTDHLCSGLSLPRKSGSSQTTIHYKSLIGLLGWFCLKHLGVIMTHKCFKHNHPTHNILILDKSSIKWRQRPDITIAVDWDVNHQTNTPSPRPPPLYIHVKNINRKKSVCLYWHCPKRS